MIIIIMLSLIMDLCFGYYLPFFSTFFTYFKPLLFITTGIVYLILEHQNKKKMKILLNSIIIYDLLFNKVYFLYLIIFILLYKVISYLNNRWNHSIFTFLVTLVFALIIFLTAQYFILIGINVIQKPVSFLLDQIITSLFLNILYSLILYYFLGIKKRKA